MDKKADIEERGFGKIILVTGGQRSGKSVFAEKLALDLTPRPVYLATARIYDAEMLKRVELHQKRREKNWRTIEEPLYISEIEIYDKEVVLLDCLTLLSTNWMFEEKEDLDNALASIKNQLSQLLHKDNTFIIVTNEIGMGGVSANPLQRKFADLQGWINQYVAKLAEDVYLLVSGIPVKIK